MCELKRALDAKGNGVLEMPTGTGGLAFPCFQCAEGPRERAV